MIRPGRAALRTGIFATVLVLLHGAAGIAGAAAAPAAAADSTDVEWDPDLAALWSELAEAGAPPLREELEEEDRGAEGSLALRWSASQGVSDRRVRGAVDWEHARLDARWRRRGAEDPEVGAAGTLRAGPFAFHAGRVGLSHGAGLLSAAPGRRGTPTADASLLPRERGVVPWAGAAERGATLGGGAVLATGAWRLEGLITRDEAGQDARRAVRAAWNSAGAGLAAAAVGAGDGQGFSLSGRLERGAFAAAGEAARWYSGGSAAGGAGWVGFRWRPDRRTLVETSAATASPPPGVLPAARPGVLPDWDGSGAAVRVRHRGGGFLFEAVFGSGRSGGAGAEPSREALRVDDIRVRRQLRDGWEVQFRVRRATEERRTWSERFPWLPPEVASRTASEWRWLELSRATGRGALRLAWRSLVRTRLDAADDRRHLAASGSTRLGRAWRVNGAWTTAWGGGADLVSAVAVFPGMVLPRHWGDWRSETVLGITGRWREATLRVGWSRRTPAVPAMGALQAIWAEASCSF